MWWRKGAAAPAAKAVAYYRHSAQDRQENSIPIQREQVRKFAGEHGVEIVREFADHGKSGLSTEGRDGFNEVLRLVADPAHEFDYVLVLDVSRWGRFQDTDMSAYYRGYCKKHDRRVVYTSMGFGSDGDLMHSLRLSMEGYQAAHYSRELSDKVFKGCVKIAQQGFRPGGTPPYGLRRLLLDEQRKPVQILSPGQRKSIQNQRVTLAPGDKGQVAVVRRIFRDFVQHRRAPAAIADLLNRDSIPSPGGKRWSTASVHSILRNELYVGTMVYSRTSQKLQSPSRANPREEWVRRPGAFKGVVDEKLFRRAQDRLDAEAKGRERRYSDEDMLLKLHRLHKRHGIVTAALIAGSKAMVSPATYAKRFASLDMAVQRLHAPVLRRARQAVKRQLAAKVRQLEEFNGFLVLNETLSILVQPSVPVPTGYHDYWAFRPDPRVEVDITLGVPLSNDGKYDILGYLLFPRLLVPGRGIRLFSSSDGKLELHGHRTLDVFDDLLS